MAAEPFHWLFSYGTLQQADVQIELFGRRLEGEADILTGFTVGTLQITDEAVVASSTSNSAKAWLLPEPRPPRAPL